MPKTKKQIQGFDEIQKAAHYNFGKFEVIDVLQDWFGSSPLLWTATKYISRAHHKEDPIKDLQKAKYYLDKEIARLAQIGA